ncbi:MAG: HAMP domain-containing sensor histidine kinase [Acidobacteriota bacterium]
MSRAAAFFGGPMKGLRLLFLAVVILLWVPVALLVRHALDNVEKDRENRHRSVAERFFDEMERELTEWLHDEENRPFGQYRFLYTPETAEPETRRSPLADGPESPFVLAHFQVEPDGTVSSPLWPRDADRANRILGWRMAFGQELQRDMILGVLRDLVLVPTARAIPLQDAGTTVGPEGARQQMALARLREGTGEGAQEFVAPLVAQPAPPPDDRDLFSLLNRAQTLRRERETKTLSQVSNVFDIDGPGLLELDDLGGPERVDVSLEPMVGRPLDASSLLLYRTVWIDTRAFRQGMVIDGRTLVDWLASEVLGQPLAFEGASLADSLSPRLGRQKTTLPGLSVSWESVGEGQAPAWDRFEYRHRFAEPFSSVAARIDLDPLPDPLATLYIYSLAALLGLTSTLGLWALYRAVAARLRFAERQSNFVSAVTHELKTPLTAIRMHGEMLRDGVVSTEERRQDYYRVVTAEAERLTRLINNVLELSRVETHNREPVLESGDLRPALREVVEVLAPHAEGQGFSIEIDDDGPAEAVYDRDALSQVLFNLVDNALKYAKDAAQKVITVRSRNIGPHVEVSVGDRGPGVPRQQLRNVFEPFFRGENEMTRTTKGTGIGLSLVRSLIEPMGGTVRGRNRDGGGFLVEIKLPAAEVAEV